MSYTQEIDEENGPVDQRFEGSSLANKPLTAEEQALLEEPSPAQQTITRCIRALLPTRYRWKETIGKEVYNDILKHQKTLEPFFAVMGLKLIIVDQIEVVYLADAPWIDPEKHGSLGRREELDAWSTLVLAFLRREQLRFMSDDTGAEYPEVDIEDMKEQLHGYYKRSRRATSFEAVINKAVDFFKAKKVLIRTMSPHVFQISPVVEVLMPADLAEDCQNRLLKMLEAEEAQQEASGESEAGDDIDSISSQEAEAPETEASLLNEI